MKKRMLCVLMAAATVFCSLSFTGCGEKGSAENEFGFLVFSADGVGEYYDDFNDNPALQWLNQQTWDTENHTISRDGDGKELALSFVTPVAGSEGDFYNTMISTGEYPELMDLSMAGSVDGLISEGILIDITEYVEKYMPDYVKLLEEHPSWKAQSVVVDEDGKEHYYWLSSVADGPADAWNTYAYRRDWLVDYAVPTEYVWDWDSEYVKENGHPAVTPLSEAQKHGNLEGWKKNEVTEFTSSEGEDPNNDYTDNVIFPSGTDEPLYVSDWEWMLEAYQKAIKDRGWEDDSNAYGISIYFNGTDPFGELVSSFGGATGSYYINRDGKVEYSGITDNFKAYIECMASWDDKGWLDSAFEQRSSDTYFQINETGYMQGKVGMWSSMTSLVGTTIRASCQDERDKERAYVCGCSVPINDVYGGDEQKFKEPDALCQVANGITISGKVGITNKVEGKDVEALFTCLNWLYTREGSEFATFGLTKEQYESAEFDPDVYKEYNLTEGTYEKTVDEEGKTLYKEHLTPETGLDKSAFRLTRLTTRVELTGHGDVDYSIDKGYDKVTAQAVNAHDRYLDTGSTTMFSTYFTEDEMSEASKVNTPLYDYTSQAVPKLIKEGLGGWDEYVAGIQKFDVERVCEIYQPYVDAINGDESK